MATELYQSPISQNLTKKFLMGLPEGVLLVSNICHAPGLPSFAEVALPIEQRENPVGQRQRSTLLRSQQKRGDFLSFGEKQKAERRGQKIKFAVTGPLGSGKKHLATPQKTKR